MLITTTETSLQSLSSLASHLADRLLQTGSLANRRRSRSRRGALAPLACIVLFAMLGVMGLSINIAYIELVRTEQRLATDAAAKAALVVLGQTQSAASARAAAIRIASLHRVGGQPLKLTDAEIESGSSVLQSSGTYAFTPVVDANNTAVINSIRINSNLSRMNGGGVSLVMMPQLMGMNTYTASQSGIATRIDMDVCLVVDRSGSMAWDLSSKPFSYPGTLNGKSAMQNYFQLPHPTLSRWAALRNSVDIFITVLNENPIKTRVSLASYSSNFTFGVYSSSVASLDQSLTTNYASLTAAMKKISSQPLIGNTNIAAGLREGISSLTDPNLAKRTSFKTIILLTDGVMSQGDDPVGLAASARTMNIRTHTIAFSAQADVNLMQKVAQAGGGQSYVAPDAASLKTTFKTIAATLPNMLTN